MENKKCKKCGKEINSSTKKCLNCGKDQRFFLFRHPIIYTCIVIIALCAIFTGTDSKQVDISEADIIEKQSLSTEEKKEYKVGEIFVNGNLDVKYISVNPDFKKHSQYANVKSQHKVVEADFEFQNASLIDRLITSTEFKCYADGNECERFYSIKDSSFSTTLLQGKKITKSVYFQVPANSKEIKIKYETIFSTNGYIEFIVK